MLLDPGESVVKQGPVRRINPQGTREGLLTLTDRRIVFEAHVPRGPQGEPIVRTTIDAPLRRIRNAELVRPGAGAPRFEVELPAQRALFETAEAEAWLALLVKARAAAPAPLPTGGAPAPPAVVLRCRYCGSLNPPTASRCASCGAAI